MLEKMIISSNILLNLKPQSFKRLEHFMFNSFSVAQGQFSICKILRLSLNILCSIRLFTSGALTCCDTYIHILEKKSYSGKVLAEYC